MAEQPPVSPPVPVLALLRSDPTGRRYGGIRLSFDTLHTLADLGHPVAFVATGDLDSPRRVRASGIAGYVVPFARPARRLRRGVPYQVAKRWPGTADRRWLRSALAADRDSAPPVLLLEQFPMFAWFGALAGDLPRSPRVLREHNDEPRYAAIVAAHTVGPARLAAAREVARVSALYRQRQFLDAFDLVVAISAGDDVARYGFTAPIAVAGARLRTPATAADRPVAAVYEFGIFGSLDHGPNVAAVAAFLADVWPEVVARRPVRLLVAGHAPNRRVRHLVGSSHGVDLLADPPHAADVYARCSAMIDPSAFGTGVAVKTLEALTYGKTVFGFDAARRGLAAPLAASVQTARSNAALADLLTGASPTATVTVDVTATVDEHRLSALLQGVARGG